MLQVNDLVRILTDMEENGDDGAHEHLMKTLRTNSISTSTLKYINDRRPLDVTQFYEMLRKNHNRKKSPLYKNIVKDIEDPNEAISTLSAFVLQLFLYGKHVTESNKILFFKHVRAEEATRVLNLFYKNYDVTSAMKLLRLLKADLLALETATGRREEK